MSECEFTVKGSPQPDTPFYVSQQRPTINRRPIWNDKVFVSATHKKSSVVVDVEGPKAISQSKEVQSGERVKLLVCENPPIYLHINHKAGTTRGRKPR